MQVIPSAAEMRAWHTTDERGGDLERERLRCPAPALMRCSPPFNAGAAADRDRQRAAWAELDVRQKRLAAEGEEATRFHAGTGRRGIDTRAPNSPPAIVGSRHEGKLQRVAALREEAAALDARAPEHPATGRRTGAAAGYVAGRGARTPSRPGAEPSSETTSCSFDRTADRDLDRWATELAEREERPEPQERAAVQAAGPRV